MSDRILIVEDETTLRETLVYNLERQGYEVQSVGDGSTAVEAARQYKPDLILLDIILPGMDGFWVCRVIRQEMTVPIVFLTARDEEIDRVLGLEIGGDDYVVKPFSMRELLARVKAHLRTPRMIRGQFAPPQEGADHSNGTLTLGNLTILEKRREVLRDGQPLSLKPREYDLLLFFTQHRGQVISREQIANRVWASRLPADHRTVDVHVCRLREKIEDDPAKPTRIITIWGLGYRFDG